MKFSRFVFEMNSSFGFSNRAGHSPRDFVQKSEISFRRFFHSSAVFTGRPSSKRSKEEYLPKLFLSSGGGLKKESRGSEQKTVQGIRISQRVILTLAVKQNWVEGAMEFLRWALSVNAGSTVRNKFYFF